MDTGTWSGHENRRKERGLLNAFEYYSNLVKCTLSCSELSSLLSVCVTYLTWFSLTQVEAEDPLVNLVDNNLRLRIILSLLLLGIFIF